MDAIDADVNAEIVMYNCKGFFMRCIQDFHISNRAFDDTVETSVDYFNPQRQIGTL